MDEKELSPLLIEMGIYPNIHGYKYIMAALAEIEADKGCVRASKIIYPSVAKAFNSTVARVERNIRHAIGYAHFNQTDRYKAVMGKYFITKKTPTVGGFLGTLHEVIRLGLA